MIFKFQPLIFSVFLPWRFVLSMEMFEMDVQNVLDERLGMKGNQKHWGPRSEFIETAVVLSKYIEIRGRVVISKILYLMISYSLF